ncbi:MAG: glycosyltransferase [Ruthenibacterium sp.]
MMPKVSVIVPVYNVEKYIKRCVDSLLHQTEHDIEIILVDDGSTDHGGRLCDAYAKQDARVTALHQKNGGPSAARNAGIAAASGSYLAFVDSDDWLSLDAIAYLLALSQKYQAEISVCAALYTDGTQTVQPREYAEFVFDKEQALAQMLYQKKFDTSAWGKLYRADIFQNIRYPVGKWYEDLATTYKTFLKAEKIAFGEKQCYFYFQRADGIMRSKFSEKRLEQLAIADEMYEEIAHCCPATKAAALSRKASSYFQILMLMPAQKTAYPKEKLRILSFLRENRTALLQDKNTRLKNRAAFLLLPLGDVFLRAVYNRFIDKKGS